jgi:hypothetical protein
VKEKEADSQLDLLLQGFERMFMGHSQPQETNPNQ